MLDIKVLIQIKKDAKKSIKTNSDKKPIQGRWNGIVFVLLFYVLPLLTAAVPWFIEVKLSTLEGYIGTGIAIFTGLFFSLLLNISSKIRIEKENPNIDSSNFQAFKENMKQISHITQYVIILGIEVMILLLANNLLNVETIYIEQVLTSMALYLLTKYFVNLFFMLQRFHFVLRDEISNIM